MSSQSSRSSDAERWDGPSPEGGRLLAGLLADPRRRGRITHVQNVPARQGRRARWPHWAPRLLVDRFALAGIEAPWEHQVLAAEHARAGRSVIIATGTASGKSLAYLLPALTAVLGEEPPDADASSPYATGEHPTRAPGGRTSAGGGPEGEGTVLYLAPTKALASDQLRSLRSLRLAKLRAATYDGDTPRDERGWVRQYANYVLTNPDMLHRSILPGHARWTAFLRRLRYVIIDEAHGYRGVFGSHVAQVLRRLRRICARYGASPVFVLASATTAEPAVTARRLTGLPIEAVADDASPRAAAAFALWEPPLTDLRGEHGAPVRRTATAEAADLLADLVVQDVQTLAFVRSRRGAESVALGARRALEEAVPELSRRVAAYRAGYLPEERRALEAALRSREIVGLASTNALELGVDVSGLDAVLVCGWPGTRASLWQQAGRAGRAGQEALAVLVARDDPLDTYLVHHPEAIFGTPVEATVLDPDNPYVLEPHLCAAAAESPLTEADLELFGPVAADVLPDLVRRGMLRRRATGWYWTRRERACDLADIRGAGGPPVQVVESSTGRLLGTVDEPSAHTAVHEGAVYLHQGESFVVQLLDLEDSVALVEPAEPDYSTTARDITDIRIIETLRTSAWGEATLCFGTVEVTRQVVAYQMRRLQSGEVLGEKPLDLPPRTLRTRAVWWTLSGDQLEALGDLDLPGAAHAAEHASIGLLPLFATCDRWDIGGVSTALHPDTGLLTVFVYDGHEGGAGFAERGYSDAAQWLHATREAILACECEAGCPSCIQSPKCGNGNDPLDKQGAVILLGELLRDGPKSAGP
ncbi:DEAD/DEAH box helicase domain-containing protein [Thermomonospora echinospora]|uniref:DEAD/DEAH box helicase domain-containing protein n=1 Tax=Thermomonospora echinospora TaxID=1992 RepID=A0A1H6CEW0_9ACTN|nr:DEAD/DEAH box helicase [Thermomonospora echinospora]SEG71402.1 DEAD/DEAH box helicase domain-containing protein [Thermomonospora echinospora]